MPRTKKDPIVTTPESKPKSKIKLSLGIISIAVIWFGVGLIADTYFNFLWYQNLHLETLFWKPLLYNFSFNGAIGIIFIFLLSLNLFLISRAAIKFNPTDNLFIKNYTRKFWLISLLITTVIVIFSSLKLDTGTGYLAWLFKTPFNLTDPIFNKDISYFIFDLQFLQTIFNVVIFFAITNIIIAIIFTAKLNTLQWINRSSPELTIQIKKFFWIIISSLIGLIIFTQIFISSFGYTAVIFWLIFIIGAISAGTAIWNKQKNTLTNSIANKIYKEQMANFNYIAGPSIWFFVFITTLSFGIKTIKIDKLLLLLSSSTDAIATGISHADKIIWLPYLTGLGILLIIISIISLIAAFKIKYASWIFFSIATLTVFYVAAGHIAYSIYDRLIVTPNELSIQSPYIDNHIKATRQAWGIDKIQEQNFDFDGKLTSANIKDNQATFDNLRLWNRQQLLEVFKQTQSLRSYYDFLTVDDDRYFIADKYRQIMLGAREINSLHDETSGFINNSIIYTHGFGLVAAPSAEVTEQGSPVLINKDIPPVGPLNITEPRIYFGESMDKFLLVNAQTDALDYPMGENNIYSQYKGSAGVKIDSWWKRLLAARKFDYNLLFTNEITPETKIIFHTNNYTRLSKLFPFLNIDSETQMVVNDDGKLVWLGDGYTESGYYPYSNYIYTGEFAEYGKNYLRNSVKFTIDAYNGDIQAYIADENDPIIQTLSKMYPGVFKPLSEMPAGIKSHIQYPSEILARQAEIYSTYHMQDPKTFYNLEDQWDIITENDEYLMRHLIMKLPGEAKEEFVFMLPFTPKGKTNLINWLAVRNDGDNYGQIISYSLPKSSQIYGPEQIKARINQDPVISQQLTLWDRSGSKVVLGSLFAIPIEKSFVYVQPLYLYSTSEKSIPELRGVIMAHGEKIVLGNSVTESISKLFGNKTISNPSPTNLDSPRNANLTTEQTIKQASKLLEQAQAAQKSGDWKKYGELIKELENLLNQKF